MHNCLRNKEVYYTSFIERQNEFNFHSLKRKKERQECYNTRRVNTKQYHNSNAFFEFPESKYLMVLLPHTILSYRAPSHEDCSNSLYGCLVIVIQNARVGVGNNSHPVCLFVSMSCPVWRILIIIRKHDIWGHFLRKC